MAMSSTRIVRTPRGSTLDSVGANIFRACDRTYISWTCFSLILRKFKNQFL